ncbi:hypothetical protein FXO37_29696 [Capsicum annuum]|nr:hypothetical protein FXO37_29696 [Capsicum annuum]
MMGHVGCSADMEIFPRLECSRDLPRGDSKHSKTLFLNKEVAPKKKLGPDLLAQSFSNWNIKRACYNEPRTDPLEEELKANAFTSILESQLTSHEEKTGIRFSGERKHTHAATVQEESVINHTDGGDNLNQNELLSRSLVGSLTEDIPDIPPHNQFLFEFSSTVTAEHVVRGDWQWKKHKFNQQWWSPTVGSVSRHEKVNQVWHLQLWSEKVFKEIGEFCGG